MASGKTHVARQLSVLTGAPVIDLDARIEEDLGDSIPHVFAERGEKYFRTQEKRILEKVLLEAQSQPVILSTGGGIVTQAANRELLKNAQNDGASVIYLRATPQTLARRIREEPGTRPLIDGDGELNLAQTTERVKVLLSQRSALYEDCASVIIDTDALTIDEVARAIINE